MQANETKYTPGPWKVSPIGSRLFVESENQDDINDSLVVDIQLVDDTASKTDFANAALIAAAPELLEACREMLRTLTAPSRQLLDTTRQELAPWIPMLRAAIAKAEGR